MWERHHVSTMVIIIRIIPLIIMELLIRVATLFSVHSRSLLRHPLRIAILHIRVINKIFATPASALCATISFIIASLPTPLSPFPKDILFRIVRVEIPPIFPFSKEMIELSLLEIGSVVFLKLLEEYELVDILFSFLREHVEAWLDKCIFNVLFLCRHFCLLLERKLSDLFWGRGGSCQV